MNDKLICEGINSKGYGIIPKLIMQDRTIHATAKCIYAYFCSFAGAGALCFPTRSKICYDLCISIDTYGKYLRQLIEHGYIKCEQFKENGRFSHNVYTLCSTISPCPKISDTEDIVYDNLDTNNNNIKNNNINKSNNKKNININNDEKRNFADLSPEFLNQKIDNLSESVEVKKLIKQIFFVNRPRRNLSVSGECVWLFVKKLNELSQGNEDKKISLLETAVLRGYGDLSETIQSTQTRKKSNYKPNKNEVKGDEAWNSFMEEMQNEEINVDVISEKTAYEELPF